MMLRKKRKKNYRNTKFEDVNLKRRDGITLGEKYGGAGKVKWRGQIRKMKRERNLA